jgi:hypothetical protein
MHSSKNDSAQNGFPVHNGDYGASQGTSWTGPFPRSDYRYVFSDRMTMAEMATVLALVSRVKMTR